MDHHHHHDHHDHGHHHHHHHHDHHGHGHHHHGHDHHDHAHDNGHRHHHHHDIQASDLASAAINAATGNAHAYALTAAFVLSLLSFLGVLCISISSKNKKLLTLSLTALGAGALLGDVFLHLLPSLFATSDSHAPHDHSHEHPHSHGHHHHHGEATVGLCVLLGFFICMLVEILLGGLHSHGDDDGHNHDEKEEHISTHQATSTKPSFMSTLKKRDTAASNTSELSASQPVVVSASKKVTSGIKPSAYVNLLADGVHNFFDGLAIAASFSLSTKAGFATTFATCFHEIPQELGDFGVLLSSGCSVKQALLFNFLSGLTCVLGAAVGIFVDKNVIDGKWIMAATAGSFLYIAAVDMVPQLMETCSKEEHQKGNKSSNKARNYAMFVSFFSIGVFAMWVLGVYEHDLEHIGNQLFDKYLK